MAGSLLPLWRGGAAAMLRSSGVLLGGEGASTFVPDHSTTGTWYILATSEENDIGSTVRSRNSRIAFAFAFA